MELKCLKWLDDVRQAAELISKVTDGLSEADYLVDRFLRCGVERNFEIIGEALGRLRKADPGLFARIPDGQQIVDFRNLIIHGYDVIRDADVWKIVQSDLPGLRQTVAMLIVEQTAMPNSSPIPLVDGRNPSG